MAHLDLFAEPEVADRSETRSPHFVLEIWAEVRPYFVKLSKDFLIATMLWVFLFLFHLLARLAPIEPWVDSFVSNLHAATTVVAFVLLGGFSLVDIFRVHAKGDE